MKPVSNPSFKTSILGKNRFACIFYFLICVIFCQCSQKLPAGDPDNGGLFLPEGFEALVVVDSLKGRARHLAVKDNGDIYVKLRFPDSVGGNACLLYTSPSPRDGLLSRMPSSA